MKKMNKKVLLIITAVILVIAIVIGIVIILFGSNKKKLENKMEEYAVKYYENQFYQLGGNTNEEKKENVKQYAEKGIKVSLENLVRYFVMFEEKDKTMDELLNEFTNSKTKKKCNQLESNAFIFPTDPYGEKDYKLKIELSCDF